MGSNIMNKGLTKARCVRHKKKEGLSLTDARIKCKVKGTYKGERRRTGKRAFTGSTVKSSDYAFTPKGILAYNKAKAKEARR